LLVLGDDSPDGASAVGRALTATAAMTMGFTVVFGLFGLALTPVAGQIEQHLPWFTVAFGVLLAVVGLWLMTGRDLPALLPKPRRAPAVTRSIPSMALFGAAYALASLGCTIAPFLVIVMSAFRAGSVMDGVTRFAVYAAGMGLVVGAAAMAVALTRSSVVGRLRSLGAAASRLGGALVALVGSYVAYYGWYEARVMNGGPVADPVVEAGGTVQRWMAQGVYSVGPSVLAAVSVLLLAMGLAHHRGRRRRGTAGRERGINRTERSPR
jgi:cytochrome c biogenesis protein CcdA